MHQIIKANNLTWIDIKGPTEDDLEFLKERLELHPLVLKELLPPLDHPKIENFGDYLFLVLFYPFFDRTTSSTVPFELDIVVSHGYIITNHYNNIVPLKAIFDKCNLYEDIREEFTDSGTGELLYRIIQEILIACFPKLSHIKGNIDDIEKAICKKEYERTVEKISLVQRDIIGFQRIIEPQRLVLEGLTQESQNFFDRKLLPYFHNLTNLYNRVDDILNTRSKTLSALDSMNQSLLATRTNEIIKTLTIFSVIVFPLTLLAALFGMNTKTLPFVGVPGDFWIVLGVMILGAFVMLGIFKHKKWI